MVPRLEYIKLPQVYCITSLSVRLETRAFLLLNLLFSYCLKIPDILLADRLAPSFTWKAVRGSRARCDLTSQSGLHACITPHGDLHMIISHWCSPHTTWHYIFTRDLIVLTAEGRGKAISQWDLDRTLTRWLTRTCGSRTPYVFRARKRSVLTLSAQLRQGLS